MLIEKVLPLVARAAEFVGDRESLPVVAEESALQGCSPQRLFEFRAARRCAHQALGFLGFSECVIPRGAQREPLWPAGIVGSITHCRGYCAAAVGCSENLTAIGIDAEIHAPLSDGVSQIVMSTEEALNAPRVGSRGIHIDCVVFSAKEAVYKTWFPLMRRWLGFHDVFIEVDTDRETFTAHLLHAPLYLGGRSLSRMEGRFIIGDIHVVSAIAIPRE